MFLNQTTEDYCKEQEDNSKKYSLTLVREVGKTSGFEFRIADIHNAEFSKNLIT